MKIKCCLCFNVDFKLCFYLYFLCVFVLLFCIVILSLVKHASCIVIANKHLEPWTLISHSAQGPRMHFWFILPYQGDKNMIFVSKTSETQFEHNYPSLYHEGLGRVRLSPFHLTNNLWLFYPRVALRSAMITAGHWPTRVALLYVMSGERRIYVSGVCSFFNPTNGKRQY